LQRRSLEDDHSAAVVVMMMATVPVVMAMPEMPLQRPGIRVRHGKKAQCERQQ
jgi:hypothetical protein